MNAPELPGALGLAIFALAIVYAYYLVSEATIFERPRDWLLLRLPERAETFIECPWCVGLWLSLAAWGAWIAFGDWAVWAATPLALAASNGLLNRITKDP